MTRSFLIAFLLIISGSMALHAQKFHIEIYKDGEKKKDLTLDGKGQEPGSVQFNDAMQKMQAELDSLGKQLAKLYSDSTLFKYNSDQMEKMNAQLHQQLDDLVSRMQDQREKSLEHNYSYSYSLPARPADSSAINIGRYRVIIKGDSSQPVVSMPPLPPMAPPACQADYEYKSGRLRWGGIGIGWNGLIDKNGNTSSGPLQLNNGRSIEVQLDLFKQYFNLINHHLYFNYGLSFIMNNYRLPENEMLQPRSPSFTYTTPDKDFKKNKLSDTYLSLPVALRYESNPRHYDKSFHLEIGAFGGYRINSHVKEVKDDDTKIKQWDSFNLNDFRYGTKVTLGYGKISFYTTYSFSTFFKKDQGTEYQPFSIGITLLHI